MQIVRTVIWVLLLVALLLFSIANWDPTVTVRIWDGIVVDTKIPAIVIVSFLIGFLPMWLYYRGSKWRTDRKIASLENAARTAAATPVAPTPSDVDGNGVSEAVEREPARFSATPTTAATADGADATHPSTSADRDGDGVPDAAEDDPLSPTPAPGTYRAPGE